MDIAVGIHGSVVGKRRQLAIEIDVFGLIVHTGRERDGLVECKIHIEETFQPVGLTQQQSQIEIVVGVFPLLGQSWQGGKLGSDEADETLWQRLVVEVSLHLSIGKIALQRNKVHPFVIAGGNDQVV